GDDGVGTGKVTSAREHGHAVQHPLFFGSQQVVRPVDGAAQRLVTLEPGPTPASKELETLVEPFDEILQCQGPGTRGSELNCEWDPVKSTADLRNGWRVAVGELEVVVRVLRTVDEEANGRR